MGLNSRNMFTILVVIVVLSCIFGFIIDLDALLFMSFFYFSNKSSESDQVQNVKAQLNQQQQIQNNNNIQNQQNPQNPQINQNQQQVNPQNNVNMNNPNNNVNNNANNNNANGAKKKDDDDDDDNNNNNPNDKDNDEDNQNWGKQAIEGRNPNDRDGPGDDGRWDHDHDMGGGGDWRKQENEDRLRSYNEEHPFDYNIPRYHAMNKTIEKVKGIFSPVLPPEGIKYFYKDEPTRAMLIHSFTQNCELVSRVLFQFTRNPNQGKYHIYIALYGNETDRCMIHLKNIYANYIKGIITEPKELANRDINDYRYRMIFYQYAMNVIFADKRYDIGIILEEKTVPSEDLIDYSLQTETLLFYDPSVFCVSYYNDNGYMEYVFSTVQLYRSELFPTYGYMVNRKTWTQVSNNWPSDGGSGWDHFIRTYVKEYDLECIIPEYSRVHVVTEYQKSNENNDVDDRSNSSPLEWFKGKSGTNFGELSYLLQANYEIVLQELFRTQIIYPIKDLDVIGFDWSNHSYYMENSTTIYTFTQQTSSTSTTVSNLLSKPKGYHKGTIIVPYPPNGIVIFADKSQSIYLPKDLRIGSQNDIVYLTSAIGQDCSSVCDNYGWFYTYECVDEYIAYANKCDVMKKYFGCENGCVMELGDDVPAYVATLGNNYHKCVTTESTTFMCSGSHERTQRLCPCTIKPAD